MIAQLSPAAAITRSTSHRVVVVQYGIGISQLRLLLQGATKYRALPYSMCRMNDDHSRMPAAVLVDIRDSALSSLLAHHGLFCAASIF